MRTLSPYAMAPAWLGGLTLAFLVTACGGDDPDADPDGGAPGADANGNGNGTEDVCGDDYLDCDTFEQEIMPAWDLGAANCTSAACHDATADVQQAGFGMYPEAEPGSDAMGDNFDIVRPYIDFAQPEQSVIVTRSTDNHGASVIEQDEADTLIAWIEDAAEAADDEGDTANTCADPDQFNLGVFEDEIFPVLDGFDLNDNQQRDLACTGDTCHAQGGQSANLTLDPDLDPEDNLENFACFINFANPVQSQALLCAQNQPGCRVDHPGGDFFQNSEDANYQRVLGYIYGSSDISPLDFAFFASNIQPIFDDEDDFAVGNQTCQDGDCHGINNVGDTPPNRSNFPILRNVGDRDLQGLTENFVNATSFTNFEDAEQSSLFLFPTDEVAHLGGAAIDLNDADNEAFAEDVLLNWIGGLRPDGDGFGRHWLVAGAFFAGGNDDVDDIFPLPEASDRTEEAELRPGFLDETPGTIDGSSRDEVWLEFFNDDFGDEVIDLNDALPGPGENDDDRVAYAVAYALNDGSTPTDVRLTVDSPNEARVYFGDDDGLIQGGNAQILEQTIQPFDEDNSELIPIIVKVLENEDVDDFEFTAQFEDGDGDLLTDEDELVFLLGSEGGI